MRFDIELLGFDGEAPIDGLASAFEIDTATAEAIAGRVPLVVKRDVDETTAEGYFHALRELGGRVKLHKRATTPPPRPDDAISIPPPRLNEVEIDPLLAPQSPRMLDVAAIPDLQIELEDVPRPASVRAPSMGAAATALVSRAPADGSGVDRVIPDKGGFIIALARAYIYPFQKTVLPSLIALPVITQIVSYAPIPIGLLIGNGLWISYLFAVTKHASEGREDLPLAPDMEHWLDTIKPLVRYVLALVVPGLLILALFAVLTAGTAHADRIATGGQLTMAAVPVLVFIAVGLWLLYLPASLILAAHSQGCLGGLNLIAGVKLIIREPVGYMTMLASIAPAALLVVVFAVGAKILDPMIPIPFVPGVIGLMLSFIPALVVARILGLFLWHFEDELSIG